MGRRATGAHRPVGPAVSGPTRLYRWYDADGQLLYVGVTHRPTERSNQHLLLYDWTRFAVRTEIEADPYPTRQDALRAEAEAIRTEFPTFNIAGALGAEQRIRDYLAARDEQPPAGKRYRVGRPEVGGRFTFCLGDILARLDAARGRTSRASWLRDAAEHALTCPDAAKPTDTEEHTP